MRLIDADELIKYIEDENKQIVAENGKRAKNTHAYKMTLVIINLIKTFRTAYDIDKVAGELKKLQKEIFSYAFKYDEDFYEGQASGLDKAIEIVKRGGKK